VREDLLGNADWWVHKSIGAVATSTTPQATASSIPGEYQNDRSWGKGSLPVSQRIYLEYMFIVTC
jgi:hypothetical protein